MKKFSRLIAACAASAMVLGLAMTAFAAPSVTTVSATAADATGIAAATEDGAAVAVTPVAQAVVTQAAQAADVMVAPTLPAGATVQVEKVFDLTAAITGPTNITIEVPGITAGQMVVVLHQKADGTWESVPVVRVAAGSVTATFTSLSPVAIVTYAAPRTGESYPAAAIIAIVAVCGAALCVRKYAVSNI